MVNLRTETHGKGSLNAVDLVVIAYDTRISVNKNTGLVSNHYLDVRLHPEDKRAKDQVSLALVTKKDPKSPSGYNNSARYSSNQFEAINDMAGENYAPLTDKSGAEVGTIYGVNADLFISNNELVVNTKTLQPSELSVQPNAEGRDIRGQIFDSMAEAKAARANAPTELAGLKEAEAEVQTEAEAAAEAEASY